MSDTVRKVTYCYVKVPNRPGNGEVVLNELCDDDVNLIAYTGFPARGGAAQLDFVVDRLGPVRRVARRLGLRVSGGKKAFLIQGEDRIGAVHRHLERLAEARVNIVAADAVSAGKRRYGMILWVQPRHYAGAAKALPARYPPRSAPRSLPRARSGRSRRRSFPPASSPSPPIRPATSACAARSIWARRRP